MFTSVDPSSFRHLASRWFAAWLLALAASGSLAADTSAPALATGVVTILEGEATVMQGKDRAEVAEGLRVAAGAIIETSPRTGLLRIEIDRVAIDLGPETRVLLAPEGLTPRGSPRPALYLLQGWVKLSGPEATPIAGIASPTFIVPTQQGISVSMVAADSAEIFVESGQLQLAERRGGKALPSVSLRSGESFQWQGAERGRELPHQSAAMLDHMPRAYRDTLPMHAALFEGREPEPKPLAAPAYDALQPWLDAEPALRRGFVRRFASRAREPDFRKSLVASLPAHPEWHALLFPPEPPKPPYRPPPP